MDLFNMNAFYDNIENKLPYEIRLIAAAFLKNDCTPFNLLSLEIIIMIIKFTRHFDTMKEINNLIQQYVISHHKKYGMFFLFTPWREVDVTRVLSERRMFNFHSITYDQQASVDHVKYIGFFLLPRFDYIYMDTIYSERHYLKQIQVQGPLITHSPTDDDRYILCKFYIDVRGNDCVSIRYPTNEYNEKNKFNTDIECFFDPITLRIFFDLLFSSIKKIQDDNNMFDEVKKHRLLNTNKFI